MPTDPDTSRASRAKITDIADRPDLLLADQGRRAYALLLVRTLWPYVTPTDARLVASYIVTGALR